MIVVDASIVADIFCNVGTLSALHRRLNDEVLLAPDLLPVEVASALRGLNRGGGLTDAAREAAAVDLARLRVELHPTLPLISHILALRKNMTAYDAAYVACECVRVPPDHA